MRKLTTIVAACAAASLALAGCGGDKKDDSGSTDTKKTEKSDKAGGGDSGSVAALKEKGKLRVGTKFDQPGFGLKGLTDKPEGFDVEIAKIIAKELGIAEDKIEWTEAPSKIREELLSSDKVDIVVATYTINDKRKERITFAGPYYEAGQQIMVRKDFNDINSPEDLKKNNKLKVCSVTGSTPGEEIKKYVTDSSQMVLFDSYSKCVDALRTKEVDAVTTDNVILLGFVAKSKGAFKLVGKQFTKEPYGIGVKKGDKALCNFVNEALKKNEAAYNKAWTETAGKFEGAAAAKLPAPAPCE